MTKELQAYLEQLASEKPEYAPAATTLINQARALVRLGELPESFEALGEEEIKCGDIRLVTSEGLLTIGDQQVILTKTETDVLGVLMKNRGVALSRNKLNTTVFGTEYCSHRVIDVHVARIRKKTKEVCGEPLNIKTLQGFGYKFEGPIENNIPEPSSDIDV